jgi:hypothetical protein
MRTERPASTGDASVGTTNPETGNLQISNLNQNMKTERSAYLGMLSWAMPGTFEGRRTGDGASRMMEVCKNLMEALRGFLDAFLGLFD